MSPYSRGGFSHIMMGGGGGREEGSPQQVKQLSAETEHTGR